MKRCINLDWLTVHCKGVLNRQCGSDYALHRKEYGTRYFKEAWELVDLQENDYLGCVQAIPHSPIIPKDTVLVQYANRYLYRKDLSYKMNSSMFQMGLVPEGYTRVDISCDFNTFSNGMDPMDLIKGFLSNKYIKRGKKVKYSLEGEQKLDGHNFEYIRWGKRSAGVCVYLYNKTLELEEKVDKKYIREAWNEAGLDTTRPVWRLEFSINPTKVEFLIKQSGKKLELMEKDAYNIIKNLNKGELENVFDCLCAEYMDFRINDNSLRTDRMPKLRLFHGNHVTSLKCNKIVNTANSGRLDKVLLKKLINSTAELRVDKEEYDHEILREAAKIYARQKGMEDYAELCGVDYFKR